MASESTSTVHFSPYATSMEVAVREEKQHSADHRPEILSLMKPIIYAEMEDISERTDDMLEHSLFEKYANAAKYLEDVLDLKESWALAY